MKFNPGDQVRVLAPFDQDLPEVYTVETAYMAEADTGQIEQCSLVGVESHFAAQYLEAA